MKSRLAFAVVVAFAVAILVSGAALAQGNVNVAGKWESKFESPQGTRTSTFTFEQDGDKIKGTVSGGRGDSPLVGTIKGKEIKFTVTRQTPNGEMKVEYSGTVEGDTIKGTVQMGQGSREWTATKVKS